MKASNNSEKAVIATVSPSKEITMKELTEKQFNRLTYVQRVRIFHEAFNKKNHNILDSYDSYRQVEQSDEDGKINLKILSNSISLHFKEVQEILSKLEKEFLYHMCQHYGAIDTNFKKEIDEIRHSQDKSYWIGKILNIEELNDICYANGYLIYMKKKIKNSPLHALILNEDKDVS